MRDKKPIKINFWQSAVIGAIAIIDEKMHLYVYIAIFYIMTLTINAYVGIRRSFKYFLLFCRRGVFFERSTETEGFNYGPVQSFKLNTYEINLLFITNALTGNKTVKK